MPPEKLVAPFSHFSSGLLIPEETPQVAGKIVSAADLNGPSLFGELASNL